MTSLPPKRNDYVTGPIKYRLTRTVVLIGLMGAGKTNVGRRLAAWLKAPFFDSDTEIERAADMSVSDIFDRHGEAAFRDAERKVIQRLLDGPPGIIATGGGAFMNERTRAAIAQAGISLWLKASLPVLMARTSRTSRRPLLANGDAEAILAGLIEKRHGTYALADITVVSEGQTVDHTTGLVLEALRRHGIVTA